MDIFDTTKTIGIRFIPDYILNTLKSKNVQLDTVSLTDFNSLTCVSRNDLKLTAIANSFLCKNIFNINVPDVIIDNDIVKELILLYSDLNIKQNLDNLKDVDATWSVYKTQNVLYVIINKGFTNFIINNDSVYKSEFIKKVVSILINTYGEESVCSNDLFKAFIVSSINK